MDFGVHVSSTKDHCSRHRTLKVLANRPQPELVTTRGAPDRRGLVSRRDRRVRSTGAYHLSIFGLRAPRTYALERKTSE
jgi:hypothetical protein